MKVTSYVWHPDNGAHEIHFADLSNYQDQAQFDRATANSPLTAIKATEGTGWNDSNFKGWWKTLGDRINTGKTDLRIAYFYLDSGSGVPQAQHFLDVLHQNGLQKGDLPAGTRLAIDWEGSALNNPQELKAAAEYIKEQTGLYPIIYCQASEASVAHQYVPYSPLWTAAVADAAGHPGTVSQNVALDQYAWLTPSGDKVDQDVFNGDRAALRTFAGWTGTQTSAPATSTPATSVPKTNPAQPATGSAHLSIPAQLEQVTPTTGTTATTQHHLTPGHQLNVHLSSGSYKYVIKQGDTIDDLAAKFGLTPDELLHANPQVTDPNLIYTGNDLTVPEHGAPAASSSSTTSPTTARPATRPATVTTPVVQKHYAHQNPATVATDSKYLGKTTAEISTRSDLAPFFITPSQDASVNTHVDCANFVQAVLHKSGLLTGPVTVSDDNVGSLLTHLQGTGRFADATGQKLQPGDIVGFNVPGEGTNSHIEIFLGYDQHGQPVFGGSNNVNPDGSQSDVNGHVGYDIHQVLRPNDVPPTTLHQQSNGLYKAADTQQLTPAPQDGRGPAVHPGVAARPGVHSGYQAVGVQQVSGGYDQVTQGRINTVYNFFRANGLSPAAAAGVAGNGLQEDSNLDPNTQQPGGPGKGIFQWSEGGRWDTLVKWANARGVSPTDINTQLKFSLAELKGEVPGIPDSSTWDTLKSIQGTDQASVQRAAEKFASGFEACGVYGARTANAQAVHGAYASADQHAQAAAAATAPHAPAGTPTTNPAISARPANPGGGNGGGSSSRSSSSTPSTPAAGTVSVTPVDGNGSTASAGSLSVPDSQSGSTTAPATAAPGSSASSQTAAPATAAPGSSASSQTAAPATAAPGSSASSQTAAPATAAPGSSASSQTAAPTTAAPGSDSAAPQTYTPAAAAPVSAAQSASPSTHKLARPASAPAASNSSSSSSTSTKSGAS
jgi:GH25 family lysozyme M1 (1,4-beta-N-acetylmuramidase)/LysM repeat protein